MSYETFKIKEVIEKIDQRKIYLPAIQRKFVWETEQIIAFFDSIMRGYPIGTFLFWFVKKPNISKYVFYEFIRDYHERDNYLNQIAPKPELKDEIIGILDGQQRLSSVYIALQGTYSYKKKYLSWNNDDAFPSRKLYLNLLSELKENQDKEYNYYFKFLTEEQAKEKTPNDYWFNVRNVLNWPEDPPVDVFYDKMLDETEDQKVIESIENKRNDIKSALRKLHKRIVEQKLINYFKIEEQDLDDILKIFVRVNSGGTILSKTDLLFSTIIAIWQDGRKEIEQFIEQINSRGDGFNFGNDFIMRCCLVLTDCSVLFKVKSFKQENVVKIRDQWTNIKEAISQTVDLLVEFGFNGQNLISQNATILIAYYVMKGGGINSQTKPELKKYLQHALLKKIYSGQGDTVLANLRSALRKEDIKDKKPKFRLKSNKFKFKQVLNTKLPSDKSFKISEEDIEEMLEYKKGNYTFLVLSLLYPQFRYGQIKLHQDHIHPTALFTESKLSKYKINEEKHAEWQEKKDMVPNLQLMKGDENKSKSKTPFKKWLEKEFNESETKNFKEKHYIPEEVSLKFKDFEKFYEQRRQLLKQEIKKKVLLEKES